MTTDQQVIVRTPRTQVQPLKNDHPFNHILNPGMVIGFVLGAALAFYLGFLYNPPIPLSMALNFCMTTTGIFYGGILYRIYQLKRECKRLKKEINDALAAIARSLALESTTDATKH